MDQVALRDILAGSRDRMKLNYHYDGRVTPIVEVGDMVRLIRDEPGPMPMAGAAEWGWVLRINARGRLGIQLAGFSRPRGVALGVVSDIAATNVIPGYAKGLRFVIPKWANWKNVTARSKSKGS
jgi:hypothetical protein